MFYSHEVLTSKKHGVATVWLLATIGPKSALKKINRKQILDVNVPKACQTILEPEAPMALRLQSNLLYGVSRVYSQQCVYVLSDAQHVQHNLKALTRILRRAELDPDAGKSKPDQLNLEDDPGFMPDMVIPDLEMDFDESNLQSSHHSSSRGNSLQSSKRSRKSSHTSNDSILGIIIPSSQGTRNSGAKGGFEVPMSDPVLPMSELGHNLRGVDDGFFPDVGFNFDENGEIIEEDGARAPTIGGVVSGPPKQRAAPVSRRFGEEASRMPQGDIGDDLMNLDELLPEILGNDFDVDLPPAEPFPETVDPAQIAPNPLRSSVIAELEESSDTEMLPPPRPRARGPKALAEDMHPELRGSHLTEWYQSYLKNMGEAATLKMHHRAPHQAKINASAWVFGIGIGEIGVDSTVAGVRNPLDMFSGHKLREALLGTEATTIGTKRKHSDEEDSEPEEERNVRLRDGSDEEQVGRGSGEDVMMNEDDPLALIDDTNVEIGREAFPPLEDQSTEMPWNLPSSIHGSRAGSLPLQIRGRGTSSGLGSFPTPLGMGGASSLPSKRTSLAGILQQQRRASRLASASPLFDRGGSEIPRAGSALPGSDEEDDLARGIHDDDDDFQLYGPAAAVNTQTAAQSQWMRVALNQESTNFLGFVRAEIVTRMTASAEEQGIEVDELAEDDAGKTVTFAGLLPPGEHSTLVAAQAFHHVLTLASKGLITTQQDEGSGEIEMQLVSGI